MKYALFHSIFLCHSKHQRIIIIFFAWYPLSLIGLLGTIHRLNQIGQQNFVGKTKEESGSLTSMRYRDFLRRMPIVSA